MKVAIYARVSTENQEVRGTIGSQLAVLRARVASEGHELIAEFCDDGYSGARLDRPGLDGLRDAAEAGVIEAVWCLSPDRLARVYAYQVIVLDELNRHGVRVLFTDAPTLDDDPQAQLLIQVQGVIAEYERAKFAERYRRGKLWRSRRGEVIFWKVPYGYRRTAGSATEMAHLVVYEPEATVVRRIFEDYVAGHSTREIVRRLNRDQAPSPTGKAVWGTSTIGRVLRNESYVGRAYYNRSESVPDSRARRRTRQVLRPREQWITIEVPRIVTAELFEAAKHVSRDNFQWSTPGSTTRVGYCAACSGAAAVASRWVVIECADAKLAIPDIIPAITMIRCGLAENIGAAPNATSAPTLDNFVFERLRAVLQDPDLLLAGERSVIARTPDADDELLHAQLKRLERRVEAASS